ncbi:hypothetical protein ASZ90_014059 [hydrocarbon metagenome]|uniref:Uncharacterized protein n=1 Tax=hydrocarbon metagenome TaxID=938273 RepID=A0A0W8F5W6_9ZZZZ
MGVDWNCLQSPLLFFSFKINLMNPPADYSLRYLSNQRPMPTYPSFPKEPSPINPIACLIHLKRHD